MFSLDFLLRYGFLLVACIFILRVTYFRISPNRESTFSFFLFANGVFLVTFLLHDIELSMGFAFGLFAVFAMLRYRTEPISIRDMTYLFIVIGLALMCSIAQLEYWELAALLVLVNVLAAVGESRLLAPRIVERKVNYDNVKMIDPALKEELRSDLEARLGERVVKVDVGRIDYLSDSAQLMVYCEVTR